MSSSEKNTDTYRTLTGTSEALFKDRGSRFISHAFPVSDESECRQLIDRIKKQYHDARHNCFAYILGRNGETVRWNDDGEPSGTAGKPILGQIRSAGLTNTLVIVTRYFGGTLLGTGGLINAYRSAAADALEKAPSGYHVIMLTLQIEFPYTSMNDVMKVIKDEDLDQHEHSFGDLCRMKISVRESESERILKRMERIEGFKHFFLEKK
jgi:uncharacterized YigZ family protein